MSTYDKPTVEPWMVAAAERLTEPGDLAYLAGFPRDIAASLIADIIARHHAADQDRPIAVGDVVQVRPDTGLHPSYFGMVFRVGVMTESTVKPLFHGYDMGVRFEKRDVVRIGRARWMPDGTEV